MKKYNKILSLLSISSLLIQLPIFLILIIYTSSKIFPFVFILCIMYLLGLPKFGEKSDKYLYLPICLGFILIGLVSNFFKIEIHEFLGISYNINTHSGGSAFDPTFLNKINLFIVTAFSPAIVEEIIFRKYTIDYTHKFLDQAKLNEYRSMFIMFSVIMFSSFIFGYGHLYQGTASVYDKMIMGIVYSSIYIATNRNILATIGLHMLHNFLAGLSIYMM